MKCVKKVVERFKKKYNEIKSNIKAKWSIILKKRDEIKLNIRMKWEKFLKKRIFCYTAEEAVAIIDDVTNMLPRSLELINGGEAFNNAWSNGYYYELLGHFGMLEKPYSSKYVNKFKLWRFIGLQKKLKKGYLKSNDRLEFCRKIPLSMAKRFILWAVAI